MTFNLNLWFPELLNEKPAPLVWSAANAKEALAQVQHQYPDCKVELRD